jgi:predicted GH43/DUF377 family glycosyl hydrolase
VKHDENPVLGQSPAGWDSTSVYKPVVIYDAAAEPEERYKMWYRGYQLGAPWGLADIGFATSSDGIEWRKYPDNDAPVPVLSAPAGEWLAPESVLVETETKNGTERKIYKMWYDRCDSTPGAFPNCAIHLAVSGDGIRWDPVDADESTPEPDPVLRPGSQGEWDHAAVSDAAVVSDGRLYHMWYSSAPAAPRIGYAWSADGIEWNNCAGNPVVPLGPAGSWDHGSTDSAAVVLDTESGALTMWYNTRSDLFSLGIGRASSRLTPLFRRGDCNDDGSADISDAVCILDWLFQGGAAPGCVAATDTNGDGSADISDAVYLLGHLFLGGPAPVAPFPDCGPRLLPTDRALGCDVPPESCRDGS